LTDAQVQAITNLAQIEKGKVQAIMTDIQQKRQALNTFLNAASPNPNDVGNAAIALHTSEGKIATERTDFLNQIKAQLTGDQQQKLDTLLAANGGRVLPFPGLGGPGFGGPSGRFRGPGPRQQ
jgi:Spy/CpxP family protein refolding chaperone